MATASPAARIGCAECRDTTPCSSGHPDLSRRLLDNRASAAAIAGAGDRSTTATMPAHSSRQDKMRTRTLPATCRFREGYPVILLVTASWQSSLITYAGRVTSGLLNLNRTAELIDPADCTHGVRLN